MKLLILYILNIYFCKVSGFEPFSPEIMTENFKVLQAAGKMLKSMIEKRNEFCTIILVHLSENESKHLVRNLRPLHASSAFLISRYILRLRQAAQKQKRPRCPNRKMYLEIRRADEWLFTLLCDGSNPNLCSKISDQNF